MRFLISMMFVGMLGFSSQVIAKEFRGSAAQEILRKGDVVAEAFTNNGHQTRVWFKRSYYACYSRFGRGEGKLDIFCRNIE